MRRSDKNIGSRDEIIDILRSGRVCYLSMADDGKPYVVPLHYGYAENTLYIHSAPEGRKIEILKKDPGVCFCIVADYELIRGEKACSWSTRYSCVIGTGKARVLEDPVEIAKGLAVLMAQYTEEEYEFKGIKLGNVVVIKVEIEEMTGKRAQGAGRGAQRITPTKRLRPV